MHNGIRQCARCAVTVEDRDGVRYEWASGFPHDCRTTALAWMNSAAGAALEGNSGARLSLPAFVERWLLS